MDSLYIDLLKGVLTRYVCPDKYRPIPRSVVRQKSALLGTLYSPVYALLSRFGLRLCRFDFDARKRDAGEDWPADAETMVGMKRLNNVQFCVEDVLARGIEGDFAETGVWRGGVCILMRAILRLHGVTDRKVWLADSFEGLPAPNPLIDQDKDDVFYRFKDILAVSLEEVKDNFRRYGLLDDQVKFLKGWFKDTLPASPIQKLAVLRLDGDMYESTMDVLRNLYDKVSEGGYLIVDDYGGIEACRQAVEDFRRERGILDEIHAIDNSGVFWQKGATSKMRVQHLAALSG